jgi:hypothetical protein
VLRIRVASDLGRGIAMFIAWSTGFTFSGARPPLPGTTNSPSWDKASFRLCCGLIVVHRNAKPLLEFVVQLVAVHSVPFSLEELRPRLYLSRHGSRASSSPRLAAENQELTGSYGADFKPAARILMASRATAASTMHPSTLPAPRSLTAITFFAQSMRAGEGVKVWLIASIWDG